MEKLPTKLIKNPIVEAILEIRFSSVLPDDAVFGLVYKALQEDFESFKLESQPILQLPEIARKEDPGLKYQPTYRLNKNNLSIGIGPRTLIFSNRMPYLGWKSFKKFVLSALNLINNSNVINKVERIGLRYINLINKSLYDTTNLKLSMCNMEENKDDVFTLRLEKQLKDKKMVIFQLNNNVFVSINNEKSIKASIVDIDSINRNLMEIEDIKKLNFSEIIDELHDIEKGYFFDLLNKNYLDELIPDYK